MILKRITENTARNPIRIFYSIIYHLLKKPQYGKIRTDLSRHMCVQMFVLHVRRVHSGHTQSNQTVAPYAVFFLLYIRTQLYKYLCNLIYIT